mgnify:CR=1 FL=1
MILLVDNYDSFTYNLYQYLGELGAEARVIRNDEMSAEEALALKPDRVVISPGPGTPDQSGITLELIRKAPGRRTQRGSRALQVTSLGRKALLDAFDIRKPVVRR